MLGSKYTRSLLTPLVEESGSLGEVLRKLGLPLSGGNYRMIAARLRRAGLQTAHFGRQTIASRCSALSKSSLEQLVATSSSVAQVLVKLELQHEGRAHRELTRRILDLEIDTSHFRGRGWARGETSVSHPSLERAGKRKSWPDSEVFAENSPLLSGRAVGKRLLARGWLYRCAWCEISTWRGQRLVLHLDHVNGISNDNRLVNLRLLCPNCHSQTATYGNRRR